MEMFVLGNEINRLMLWDDRIAINNTLEKMVQIHPEIKYAFIEDSMGSLIDTFDSGVPVSLLGREGITNTPNIWKFLSNEGKFYYDLAMRLQNDTHALHIGLSRSEIDRQARPLMGKLVILTLSAIVLSLFLSNTVAQKTTHEVNLLMEELRKNRDELEIRVEERTRDLKTTNQQLVASEQQLRANEKEREKLLKKLAAKNEELQSIVYITSHDLKSPLVNINGFTGELQNIHRELSNSLKDLDLDDEVRSRIRILTEEEIPESIKFISKSAEKMGLLLDGLLQVSRVGSMEIRIRPLKMNEILHTICQSMEFQIKQKDVEVIMDPLPDCQSDVRLIDQLFSNLIGNAIKYLDPERKGKVHITGTVKNAQSIYSVEDNGIGIELQNHSKIFKLFHRLNPGDTAGGEGLGLTIVSRILNRIHGTIRVESEPGKGSKFIVSLPAV